MSDAIEHYLDGLFDELAGTGAAGRRTVAEAEDHLRETQAALMSTGLSADAAAQAAVARFGQASEIAGAERAVNRDPADLARQLFSGAWLLSALGLIAIGLSGLVAEVMGRLWGAGFVAGDTNGVTYTSARCADFLEYFPGHTCAQAAALHHWGEVVGYRVLAGVLGLLGLGVYVLMRRRGPLQGSKWAPPNGPTALVGAACFGLAAFGLGAPTLLQMAYGGTTGAGANLSAALIAGPAAVAVAAFGLRRGRATSA